MRGGVGDVGVGPGLAFGVRAVVFGEGDERGAHRATVVNRDKLGGGGPVGRDHRFAEGHAFGDREAEAFGTVQRDEDVAGEFQRVDVGAGERVGDEVDAGDVGGEGLEVGEVGFVTGEILDLDDEGRGGRGEAGVAEGSEGGAGVFAGGVGVEVEEREEEERVGRQTEAGADRGDLLDGNRDVDGVRKGENGDRRFLGDGGAGEIARAPNLVVEIEGRDPVVGKFGEFPSEVGDVVFAGAEMFAVVVVEVARGGWVEVDDVDVVGIRVGEAGSVGGIAEAVFAVEFERDEGGGDAGGIGGADHATGGFAEAEIGGEEADDVEPEVRVAAGELGTERCVATGEIVDEFAGFGGKGGEAERAVFVLGAEAFQRGETGDATEPSEGVGETGAAEAQREREAGGGCGRGERETEFPRAGFEVAQRDDEGAVEKNGEGRRRGLEATGGGVRAEIAAQGESGDAVERRKAELAGFAEPGGVGREVVEENAGVVREAPGEGAAGRGRAVF